MPTGPERGGGNWNGHIANSCASNNWRESLVPAAAVIPAPRVYTKVVAVKKLVVEHWDFFIVCLIFEERKLLEKIRMCMNQMYNIWIFDLVLNSLIG